MVRGIMPPLFDTSRIRMNPRDETAEMAHGLNFHEGLPSQAAHVGQPAFISRPLKYPSLMPSDALRRILVSNF
jgi:hypothetical protein